MNVVPASEQLCHAVKLSEECHFPSKAHVSRQRELQFPPETTWSSADGTDPPRT